MTDLSNNTALGFQAYINTLKNELLLNAIITEIGALNPDSVKAIYKKFHTQLEFKINNIENSDNLSTEDKELDLSILKRFRNIYK